MEIKNQGYNVGSVVIDTPITLGTKTEIGTAEDFKKICNIAEAGGLARIHCVASNNQLDGLVLMTHTVGENYNGIDFGSVTNYGGSPWIVAGTVTLEDGKMYVTMTMNAVSGASKNSTKNSSSK